jgi:hypothetical protein
MGEPQSESEWDDEFRLSIWARNAAPTSSCALEDGTGRRTSRFDWTADRGKSYDITSSRSPSIEEACADVVRGPREAGIADTESLDEAVAGGAPTSTPGCGAGGISHRISHGPGNEGRSSVPE